jgi:hypothetical protein
MEDAAEGVVAPSVVTDETPTDVTPVVEQSEESAAPETQEQETPPKEEKAPPKWATKRINELTRDKYRERAQREMLETRLAEIESRLQAQPGVEGSEPAQQHQPALNQSQLLAQAEARVSFDMKCNAAFKEGTKEYPDFEEALSNLKMVGIDADALGVIVEADEPHKVLHYLGNNPDEASRILSLGPVAKARAIGALEVRLGLPKPTPAHSKAPAPISPVAARSASSTGLSDDLPMAEWIKRRNAQVRGK